MFRKFIHNNKVFVFETENKEFSNPFHDNYIDPIITHPLQKLSRIITNLQRHLPKNFSRYNTIWQLEPRLTNANELRFKSFRTPPVRRTRKVAVTAYENS